MRAPINDRPTRTALGRDGFARLTQVSRETLTKLEAYVALLRAWNPRINLVGPATMGDVWRRHILDSTQIFPLIPQPARVLVDIGSGAGLPGLILAAMGVPEVHLVESDQRKAVFLREAVRAIGLSATIHAVRADRMPRLAADVVTARALASLPDLLDIAEPFLVTHSICLFLKGRTVRQELTEAAKSWKMKTTLYPSVSDPSGLLLQLESVVREPRSARG